MNKKAQENNPIAIVGAIIVALILFSSLGIYLHSLSCSNEINQKETCCSERDFYKNQAESLNQTIQNCSNLIQEQRDICDNRINQSVNDCSTKLEISMNYILVSKIFFVIYHVLIIFLYFPLTINLFKIEWFKIKFRKKLEDAIGKLQKAFLITKFVIWTILTLIFIAYIINFLTSNPF